jgi:predicted acylesterase/phospholipase RssA
VVDETDRQEVRLAVVMTGGVSLAVWMGGIARELDRLRSETGNSVYHRLQNLMQTDIVIDVISGTSAGGLNGAFLAASVAYDSRLTDLRGTWLRDGAMLSLLRDPSGRELRSLLQGDEVFLPRVNEALARIRQGHDVRVQHPVELFMAAGLLEAQARPRRDRYGSVFPEATHLGLFHFVKKDFEPDAAVDCLALAARTSAAHPGGFEASYVPIAEQDSFELHPSMQGIANWDQSGYCVDGGVLLNRPLRPAVDAIFRQPADREVRRIVLFVAPDPGESGPAKHGSRENQPSLVKTIASVANLPRLQSITEELQDLDRQNDQIGRQKRVSTSLRTIPNLDRDAWSFYKAYRLIRAQRSTTMIITQLGIDSGSPLATKYPDRTREMEVWIEGILESRTAQPPEAPWDVVGGGWRWGTSVTQRWIVTMIDLLSRVLSIVPPSGGIDDVATPRRQLLVLRRHVFGLLERAQVLKDIEEEFWASQRVELATILPQPDKWREWFELRLDMLGERLRDDRGEDAREALAVRVGSLMAAAAPLVNGVAGAIASIAPGEGVPGWIVGPVPYVPSDAETETARTLFNEIRGMTGDEPLPEPSPDTYLQILGRTQQTVARTGCSVADAQAIAKEWRDVVALEPARRSWIKGLRLAMEIDRWLYALLALDVALAPQLALQPLQQNEIELVQVSARCPNALGDDRETPVDKLTGLQLAHFGAFYKSSWRANDWLWGRLDGAYQLCRALLSPVRLRRLRYSADEAAEVLRSIATGGADSSVRGWLNHDVVATKQRVLAELHFLDHPDQPMPISLPHSSEWIARRLQLEILVEEMPFLAASVAMDLNSGASESETATSFLAAYLGYPTSSNSLGDIAKIAEQEIVAGQRPLERSLNPEQAVDLLHRCRISDEKITGEYGSDLFTQTVSKAAAVSVATASGQHAGFGPLRGLFASVRGSTLATYRLADATVRQTKTKVAASIALLTLAAAVLALVLDSNLDSSGAVVSVAVAVLVGAVILVSIKGQTKWALPIFAAAVILSVLILAVAGGLWRFLGLVIAFAAVAALAQLVFSKGRTRIHGRIRWAGLLLGVICLVIGFSFALLLPSSLARSGVAARCGVPIMNLRFSPPAVTASTTGQDQLDVNQLCAVIEWQTTLRLIAAVGIVIGSVGLSIALWPRRDEAAGGG